ncbi:uncharacterized protein LOC123543596 [Mercenaria mercenaria]|uniref:uncharacterized protein LOC123543596 n=1 Tax=Mercenaria mercenaria TaxID=6596 RepID=UPI00234E9A9A|nr:uncharacterized protein LOC123543596 [Mercenaria mercenaria]
MFADAVNNHLQSQFFSLEVACFVLVFDGAGTAELESETSGSLIPFDVWTNYISMTRGKEVTFTVFLNVPFGCPAGSQDCFLRFVVYDPYDSYRCYDSSIAVIHSDTCGGKLDGAMQGTIGHVTSKSTITNITITTKNNRWYRLRRYFRLVLKLAAVGNSKPFWNTPSASITVRVYENYYTRYRGCYSFVDPYIYTFDRRWYSNQLLEEFVLLRHKTLPIEVQTVTAPCNRWATCSCAVTVRAGGDVFSINHCYGHLTSYLSAKDGILKVYKLWSTWYQIILPTGMHVYVYIMSYFNYMMNVYVAPTPSDFEQMEGLCGNFNGDFRDDTVLRGSTYSDPVETYYGYWWWWSRYFYPHAFAYSWGLWLTGRSDESLINPDVYENVEVWDSNKKLCVCPDANSGTSYDALCSADEEATCTRPIWRWGTLVEATSRQARDVDGNVQYIHRSKRGITRRLVKMKNRWEKAREKHAALRKKRQINNSTTISWEEAETICTEKLSNDCNTYSKKDDVSDIAESNDTLDNCIRDTMESGTSDWVTPHCDALTQKVTVELDKDVEFTENNTELANNIKESACPSNCSGHGQCVNQTCICIEDFATDLCLVNITIGPLIEELADEGICDVSTGSACDYILIVGNGFIETAKCNLTVYVAGTDGIFNLTDEYEVDCSYLNYNELYAPILGSNSSQNATTRRRIADDEYPSATCCSSVYLSFVGIRDLREFIVDFKVISTTSTCLVLVRTGFCYIEATCYTSGTYLSGSSCAKCDTAQHLFVWTDGCNKTDDTNTNNLIIIMSCIGGAILAVAVALALIIYFKIKAKKMRMVAPLVQSTFGQSKKTFLVKGSNVAVFEHHFGHTKGSKMAAEYTSDDDDDDDDDDDKI